MEIMLVLGLAAICDKSDIEELSMKRFPDFKSLDKHLKSIKKSNVGKFDIISLDAFVSDWNDTGVFGDLISMYDPEKTYMGYVLIG